jgi:hypothetical protein
MSKKIEKATNLLYVLKENTANLTEKGIESSVIITIEKSIKAVVKLENEIATLSEKLESKTNLRKQMKDELAKLVKSTSKLLKNKEAGKSKIKEAKEVKEAKKETTDQVE